MIDALLETFASYVRGNTWLSPLICLIAGVLTSLTPCSLSTIPLVIGYVTGSGVKDSKSAFKMSLIFAAGMAISFTALGAVASTIGMFLGKANRYFYFIVGTIMILMALQVWEIYTFIPATNLISKNKKKGYTGALIAGLLGGLFSTACATPVLVVILSIVARSGEPVKGILYLLLFAIGHGFLVVIAGTSTGLVRKITSSPNYGKYSKIINIIMGLFMLIIGFYMFYLGF